jgi:phosphate butyryltransferase
MRHTLGEITAHAQGMQMRVAVAAAQDRDVLGALAMARQKGVCSATLFGDEARIRAILKEQNAGERGFTIVEPEDGSNEACARAAIAAVVNGEADFLMKGILGTGELLRQVVHSPLVTDRLLSHVMLFEVSSYGKLLFNTDGGMNPLPNLKQKKAILENAAGLLKLLGYEEIIAACISGSESVNEKIPSTTDAKALAQMDWMRYNMTVYGPVGLDLAISEEACRHKKYTAPGGGRADILLMPNYETGNCFGKALTYFAGARSAGIVVGARCPIVLVSRADPAETKLTSLALGAIAAKGGKG